MLCNHNECVGCGACALACKFNCITMGFDEYGKYSAHIDAQKCVNCKMCESVCPVLNDVTKKVQKRNALPDTYRAYSNNQNIVKTSTSGGMSTTIADYIISNGGYCVGVCYDEQFNARYQITNDKQDLAKFQGSKYVQSIPDNIYKLVKQKLDSDNAVYFAGLPCHVAGLYSYLGKDYDKLYTADLVCHGTSPTYFFKSYLSDLENKNGKIKNISQSNKNGKNGWTILVPRNVKIEYESGFSTRNDYSYDFYLSQFLSNICFNSQCYDCKFNKLPRIGDVTLGDFFGLGTIHKAKNINKNGESMIAINSQKGQELIDSIESNIYIEKRDIKESLYYNHNMFKPTAKHPQWDEFHEDMLKLDYNELKHKYFDYGKPFKLDRKFRRTTKAILGPKLVARGMLCFYKLKGITSEIDALCEKLNSK